MKSVTRKKRLRIITLFFGTLAVLAVTGYYSAKKFGAPIYHSWRDKRLMKLAHQFADAGKTHDAILTLQRVQRDNPNSIEAWRLAATTMEHDRSTEALFYLDHLVKLDPSLATKLEFIRYALDLGYPGNARVVVEQVGPEGRDSIEFHQLAAQTYERLGRLIAARTQLYSLIALQPKNNSAQLDLAELELYDKSNQFNRGLRQRILELAKDPDLRPRALSLLLGDAESAHAPTEALGYAEEMIKLPKLTPGQRILILDGLVLGDPPRAITYRKQMEADFATDPVGCALLLRYDLKEHHAAAAAAWYASLPEKTRTDGHVERVMADIYFDLGNLEALGELTSGVQPWPDHEYLRQAYLAYASRATGHFSDADSTWRLAATQAGSKVADVLDLMQRSRSWGWNNESHELLWKLFDLLPHDTQIRNELVRWQRMRNDTAGINLVFSRLLEADPHDSMAKNNYAYTCLLLNTHLDDAFSLAKDAHEQDPKNVYFSTTYAFALYRRGRIEEGHALLKSLGPVAMSQPERMLLEAMFDVREGSLDVSADLLDGVVANSMLPQEQALITDTRRQIAAMRDAKGRNLRIDQERSHLVGQDKKGWMQLLPGTLRQDATADMRAADTVYASGDFAGLAELLRSQTWESEDHLRLALLAYAQRKTGDEIGAHDNWRAAFLAGSVSAVKLNQLCILTQAWNWHTERMQALDRLFVDAPSDQGMLKELMDHYRAAGRTTDMVRVLGTYVSSQAADARQRGQLAYYSMLCKMDLSQSFVAAKNGYDSTPHDPGARMVYAFALWQQKRLDEAWALLETPTPGIQDIVPPVLLRAALLTDMKRNTEALRMLSTYNATGALPEEANLASELQRRLTEQAKI